VKEALRELFKDCDPAVREIITKVLRLEQEKISVERPRVKEDIERIIEAVTRQELERNVSEGDHA